MAYVARTIKDRVAVGDDVFIVEDLGSNKIRLIPSPTHVSEAGTPVNKALLQPMENHMGNVANPHETTKAQVGLGNVDNIKQATKAEFNAHMEDVANPHATTKVQVGLGSVQNYGIATQAQAQAGIANDVYMTPLRVREAVESTFYLVESGSITMPAQYAEVTVFANTGYNITCFFSATGGDVICSVGSKEYFNGWRTKIRFLTLDGRPATNPLDITYDVVAWVGGVT